MPGPPAKKDARRRNARPDWRTLPADGRSGRAPAWPIGRPSKAETALWRSLWSTPQAVAWEELGWVRLVCRYARLLLSAEVPDAPVTLLGEVRQLEDRLGLSPMAMRRLQWEIGEAAAKPSARKGATVTQLDEYRQLYGA